jgi:hypothetical protein
MGSTVPPTFFPSSTAALNFGLVRENEPFCALKSADKLLLSHF